MTTITTDELQRRQREVSLSWACDLFALGGVHPDVARLAAYGRPQLAQRLVNLRHNADCVGAAFATGSPGLSRWNYMLWSRLWREVATEAAQFLQEARCQ